MGVQSAETWAVPWWAYVAIGLAWWLGVEGLEAVGVASQAAFFGVSAVAMVALGGLCLYNARACGAVHCKITGPGFLLAGLLALGGLLGVPGVTSGLVMTVFWVPAIGGFVIEWIVEARRQRAASGP